MNLLADYVQPLTSWLQANPHWSLFITFLIALSESLAVIGSIIPGSVTMTAIGILAGSGILRIDLTLISATLGAICGDSLSYFLGYFYSDRLIEIWPFNKYPGLLKYGKEFFASHGGKSVLIGRFIGPLRSIIPVIAGIMHMKQWRFLVANIISAIGWSILYVMPGVLIGAAGHELSAEGATKLFILILVVLAIIWLSSLTLKWLFIKLNIFLKKNLHCTWLKIKDRPWLSKLYFLITPSHEENHYPTVGLFFASLVTFACFLILMVLTIQDELLNYINVPIYFFMQSFHSSLLEAFFIACSQLTSLLTLIGLLFTSCLWFVYHKNYRAIIYLTSIMLFSGLIALLLTKLINSPRPEELFVIFPKSSFPSINISIATAIYGFILFYIHSKYSLITSSFKTIILIVLGLSGFANVYLGDFWFSDILAAYLLGTEVCLIHCIIYRKSSDTLAKIGHPLAMLASLFAVIAFISVISTAINFKELTQAHLFHQKKLTLAEKHWWEQQEPILPLYRLSRIGKRISLLNIQYVGDLGLLKSKLEESGWQEHSDKTFFTRLLMRINNAPNNVKLPLLTQLFENKRPGLIMTYQDKQSNLVLDLLVWESNYQISDSKNTLWIGSVHQNIFNLKQHQKAGTYSLPVLNPLSYLIPALNDFSLRRIKLPNYLIKTTAFPTSPFILLIKNK
ncbi:membrane protein [Legionella norrlandica]|uniref:Membrane protein n=1 Tax=Legionella norrlandica TaxID=1498499 RepID=A0A0A2SXF1_9GAMM|nr:bifunctional DedA family/phosphatase PAP2 family protein [Legionella norrlandica]KGP64381.1 membrane protein [Legionella norrlandica]